MSKRGELVGPIKNRLEVEAIDRFEEQGRYTFLVPEAESDDRPPALGEVQAGEDREEEVFAEPRHTLRFGDRVVSLDACFGKRRWD